VLSLSGAFAIPFPYFATYFIQVQHLCSFGGMPVHSGAKGIPTCLYEKTFSQRTRYRFFSSGELPGATRSAQPWQGALRENGMIFSVFIYVDLVSSTVFIEMG